MKKILMIFSILMVVCIFLPGCNTNQARMFIEKQSDGVVLNVDVIPSEISNIPSEGLFKLSDFFVDEVIRIYVELNNKQVKDNKISFKDGLYFVLDDETFTSINFKKNRHSSIYAEHVGGVSKPEILNYQISFNHFNPTKIKGLVLIYNTKYYDTYYKKSYYKDKIAYIPLNLVKIDDKNWKLIPIHEIKTADLSDGIDLFVVNTNSEKTKESLFQKLNQDWFGAFDKS